MQGGDKMASMTISAKVPTELRRDVDQIAAIEQRPASSVVRLAVESYVQNYFSLHPQFKADIIESRESIRNGDVEDYQFG